MNVLEKILEEIEGKMILVATSKEHYNQPQNGKYVEEVITIKDAENIIRSHMDEEKDDGWISVKKRLPEGKEVIAQNKDGEMLIGYVYYSEEMEWYECESESMYLTNVIAWQPLPEPMRKE